MSLVPGWMFSFYKIKSGNGKRSESSWEWVWVGQGVWKEEGVGWVRAVWQEKGVRWGGVAKLLSSFAGLWS